MTWNRLQSASAAVTEPGSVTFTTANLSSGTKIIVAVSYWHGSAVSITTVKDGAGNNWTKIGAQALGDNQGENSLWALDVPAGDVGTKPTITATGSGGTGGDMAILAQEVSGLLAGSTTAMCDGTLASVSGTATGSTGSPSYSTGASGEYLVAMYGDDSGANTWTIPSGYTGDPAGLNANATENIQIAYANSAGGTEAGAYSISGNVAGWAVLLVAFKLAAGGAVTPAAYAPPAWFPSAPSAPGADPFTPWPLGLTGVNTFALSAATTITAAGAAALTEAKPLNAAATVTGAGAAAGTTAKPLNAAQPVTAAAVASLGVAKAGVTPAPAWAPAWFPSAPGAPGAGPFTPWPPLQGAGAAAVPGPDLLNAAAVITATGAAALTGAKPLNAATTVTATVTASLTTAKPLSAPVTVTATGAAAPGVIKAGVTPAPACTPGWFPGAPFVPAAEAFAPWPPWTGLITAPPPPFSVGTLTAADAPLAALTATAAAGGSGGTLTASDQRTGGPG